MHPLIHGDRGYFAGWDGELPVLRGTVLRVTVEHLPDGRAPHKTMWLWHAGPAPLSLDELWRAYLARFDEEHAFKFAKTTLGLTAARVRTPEQADRWVRLVMAAFAQLLLARPHAAGLRRPWETRPPAGRPMTPGQVRRGFANIRELPGTPAHVAKPAKPGPGRPKGSASGPAPRYPVPKKSDTKDPTGRTAESQRLKHKLRYAGCREHGTACGTERRALSGLAPPASMVLRIPLRGTRLRRAVDPGDLCQPSGPDGKGQARGQAR